MALVGNISRYIIQEMALKSGDANQKKNAVIADAKAWLLANHPALVDTLTVNGTLYKYFDER